MNDAAFEAARDRVLALAERWYETLGFGNYVIEWTFDRDAHDQGGRVALLDIESLWEYRQLFITAYLAPIQRHCPRERDLERHVVHEFAHAWLDKLRPKGGYVPGSPHGVLEELTATQVADALIALRDAVLREPDAWRVEAPRRMAERAREAA